MGSLPVPATDAGRDGLAALLDAPGRALVALDFDGTLAEIVPDPEQARAHPDVVPALRRLAPRIGALAVVTGRPAEVAVRLAGLEDAAGLEHLTVLGAYGAERWEAATGELSVPPPDPGVMAVRAELPGTVREAVASGQAHIEDKGGALAVHTRRAADPDAAFAALRGPLDRLAARHGLRLEPGRYVLELRPAGTDKGHALAGLIGALEPSAVLYAGDDLGDLAAFEALSRARDGAGVPCVRVCSGSGEVPELAEAADLTVDGPGGVAAFLGALAEAIAGGR